MIARARPLSLVVALALLGGAAGAEEYELEWSSTFELRLKDFEPPVDEDALGGFFDQYEFSRNKDDEPSFELGLSELDLDLLGPEETPRLRFRLDSPTSDVGISGSRFEIGEFFLNQRAALDTRFPGLGIDLDYRRLRTEELRLFPSPTGLGFVAGSFDDRTAADDRFFVRRSGIGGEVRVRPGELHGEAAGPLGGVLSEVALRGGYEERNGKRQVRSFVDFGDWRGLTSRLDQEVTDGGAGLVLNPAGLFTLAVDFDHQRFREDGRPLLEGQQTIAFVPDTDRTTGSVRLNSRLGERAALHGGLQISSLNQEGDHTPAQQAFGLRNNKLLFYSANFGADLMLTRAASLNSFFKFDSRRNRIEREPGLFDPSDGTQIAPFLKSVRKFAAGVELTYRLPRMNRVALGVRGDWAERELEFASPAVPALTPANSMVDADSRSYTAYLRSSLRPLRGLQLAGEIGYREAPETGYVRELDDAIYGKLRASYTFPLSRPLTLSLFGRGESGENDDFTQQGGSPGNSVDRDYDRDVLSYGATVAGSPHDRVTLFASAFKHDDAQDFDLVRTDDLRFFGGNFSVDGPLDYRADMSTLILGGSLRVTEHTDASLSYSFTRSNARFQSDDTTSSFLAGASRIRSDLHRAEAEVGHWLRPGLRLSAGYRFDDYRDRTGVRGASGGSVDPFNPSTHQHTVILGVTLNDRLRR